MEAIQTAETAVIIGGVGYLLYQFWPLIKGLNDATGKIGEKVGGAVEGYAELYGDAWEATPAITKAAETAGKVAFGSKEEADEAGKQLMNEIRKEKQEGNTFIDAVEGVDKFFGGAGIPDAIYYEMLEHEKPINGVFGDLTDNKLFKMRVWYGATLKADRLSITHWNITLQREGKSAQPAITANLIGFQGSLEYQLYLIEQEMKHYERSPTTPYAKLPENMRNAGRTPVINERFEQPSYTLSGLAPPDVENNDKSKWLWQDTDYAAYLRVYKSVPSEKNGNIYVCFDTGEKTYIGLAGALDDIFTDWRKRYKEAPDEMRGHIIEALNNLEIPATYFENASATYKNRTEQQFLEHYGIGWITTQELTIEFKEGVNTTKERIDAQKTATDTFNDISKSVSKSLKHIHL